MSEPTNTRHNLLALLCHITDPQVMDRVLETLLTAREIDDLEHRLQIFQMLQKQTPQREIAAQLKVGIATVTRGAAAAKRETFAEFAQLLEQIERHPPHGK